MPSQYCGGLWDSAYLYIAEAYVPYPYYIFHPQIESPSKQGDCCSNERRQRPNALVSGSDHVRAEPRTERLQYVAQSFSRTMSHALFSCSDCLQMQGSILSSFQVDKAYKRRLLDDEGTADKRSIEDKAAALSARKLQLKLAWNLPPRPPDLGGPKRPSYDWKWVRGMYLVLDKVACGVQTQWHCPASRHFTSTCPAEFRVKGLTEQKILAHFKALPPADEDEDMDEPAALPITDANADENQALAVGSKVKLLAWKHKTVSGDFSSGDFRKVLCYPGCVGTVLSIDDSEGVDATFVEVSIKPEWFSQRTIKVFVEQVELLCDHESIEPIVPLPHTHITPVKQKVTRRHTYTLGEMQVFEAFKHKYLKDHPGVMQGVVVSAIKKAMSTIFGKLKPDTARHFPTNITKLEAKQAEKKQGAETRCAKARCRQDESTNDGRKGGATSIRDRAAERRL